MLSTSSLVATTTTPALSSTRTRVAGRSARTSQPVVATTHTITTTLPTPCSGSGTATSRGGARTTVRVAAGKATTVVLTTHG